jgi:VWFA-related protein
MRPAIRLFCNAFASIALSCGLATSQVNTPDSKTSANAAQAKPAPPGATVLKSRSRLVLVDVLVKDRAGHAVHNLPQNAFRITEDNTPQNIRSFEEVDAGTKSSTSRPAPPHLPPGVYTDYQPPVTSRALNILLIDALNTPTSDQAYLTEQLKHYLASAPAGTQTAIFGLNTELTMLQGFSSDPAVLRLALTRKPPRTPSHLSDDPNGTNADQTTLTDEITGLANTMGSPGMFSAIIANVQQFETQTKALQLQVRVQNTLDAFEELGHYLSTLPGRKNLIWFSGSFPLFNLPDPGDPVQHAQPTFAPIQSNEAQFRDVVDLLTRAQVAVYPVDARGVRNAPVFDAATHGPRFRGFSPTPLNQAVTDAEQDQTNGEATMKAIAHDTGGEALYNTNDLAAAVNSAVENGREFYTLSYAPTSEHWNNAFRSIHVELTGEAAQHGYTLAYRRGYYATAPTHTLHGNVLPTDESARLSYFAASMKRGAPAPSDLLFKAEVRPASSQTEAALAPENQSGPANPAAPYRRFAVDVVTLPQEFTLAEDPTTGIRSGNIQLIAYVLGPDGQLRIRASRTFALNLPPQTFVALRQNGMRLRLEVSAPARGQNFLRLAVRDPASQKFGVLELSLAEVAHLPPAPPASAPAATAGTTAAVSPNSAPGDSSSAQTSAAHRAPASAGAAPHPAPPQ